MTLKEFFTQKQGLWTLPAITRRIRLWFRRGGWAWLLGIACVVLLATMLIGSIVHDLKEMHRCNDRGGYYTRSQCLVGDGWQTLPLEDR